MTARFPGQGAGVEPPALVLSLLPHNSQAAGAAVAAAARVGRARRASGGCRMGSGCAAMRGYAMSPAERSRRYQHGGQKKQNPSPTVTTGSPLVILHTTTAPKLTSAMRPTAPLGLNDG